MHIYTTLTVFLFTSFVRAQAGANAAATLVGPAAPVAATDTAAVAATAAAATATTAAVPVAVPPPNGVAPAGGPAPSAAPTAANSITTQTIETTLPNGAVQDVITVITLGGGSAGDGRQGTAAQAGTIGLGTLTGSVGSVKTGTNQGGRLEIGWMSIYGFAIGTLLAGWAQA